jgi:DNA-binding transcriptional regulator GbsR (MarR family)
MVELSGNAEKIYHALYALKALSEENMKTADDIMKKGMVGKAIVNSGLKELQDKKIVKRIARQKSAGYYIIKTI